MKAKFIISILSFFMCFRLTASMDSIPWYKKFDVDVVFSFDRHGINDDRAVHDPQYLIEQRVNQRQYAYPNHSYTDYTDNPFLHFASFAGIRADYHLTSNFSFHGDLYAEHRGFSYGHLSKDIVQIFPQFYLEGHDTLKVFGQSIEVKGKLGDLINHTVNNGLTISNNDFQGGVVMGKWRGLYIRYLIIADASQNIGLNLGEFWSYKIGWEGNVLNNRGIFNAAIFRDQLILPGFPNRSSFHYGLAMNLRLNGWNFFGESSIRSLGGYYLPISDERVEKRLGALIGLSKKWNWGKEEFFSLYFDIRHYGKYFNTYYGDNGRVDYRETNSSFNGNFIGDQFYPLKNTYRPFWEWAVFAQFQSSALLASNLHLTVQKRIWKDFYFNGSLESVFLNSDEVDHFIYNFFHTGLSYNGFKGFKLEGYVSNKIMNLDVGFQTFYQAKVPFIGYRCIRWLGEGVDQNGRRILN